MILSRLLAIALVTIALSAEAQQPTQQQAKGNEQKPNPDDKISCRVSKEGNSLKRTCLTRSEWRKLESRSGDIDGSGLRNSRCQLGAC